MTADELYQELERASRSLRPCRCGSRVRMGYQPGVTRIYCYGEDQFVAAGPDWCPTELAKEWNETDRPGAPGL